MKKKIIIILSALAFLLVCYICYTYLSKPIITLNGNYAVTVLEGNEYVEENVTVKRFGKKIKGNVKIDGKVDTNKAGIYTIKYTLLDKNKMSIKTIKRKVEVVDKTAPVITLNGNNVSIYVNETYNEPGYVANDNNDGDITKKVVSKSNIDNTKVGNYEVVYTVKDSSGNTTSLVRKVTVNKIPTSDSSGLSSSGLPILMYHFFYDEEKGQTAEDNNWLEVKKFEKQMKYLSDNNYYFPTWEEVYNYVQGNKILPKKSVVITVDDGNPSFFYYAVPIINKYNVKVTSFLVTAWNKENTVNSYSSDKIQFQSHTNSMHKGGCSEGHNGKFLCVDYQEGLNDLKESLAIVKSNWVIAYPFGDVNDHVIQITKDAGFKMGVSTNFGKVLPGDDLYKLNRIRVSNANGFDYFVSCVN